MDEETVLEGKRVKSRGHHDVIFRVNRQSKRTKRFTVLEKVTCLKEKYFLYVEVKDGNSVVEVFPSSIYPTLMNS